MSKPPTKKKAAPRISVNDLALYMVSSETAKIGIIRRSYEATKPPMIRYRDARRAVCTYLSDPNRNLKPIIDAEEILSERASDPSTSPLMRDDAAHSIDVLHAIQGMKNKLGPLDFYLAPHRQDKLIIEGVTVSVRADLLVHGLSKGQQQIGCAVLRMTIDAADSEPAKQKRREMGLVVATLARMHVDQNISTNRIPANRLCMSIDIQHGEVFLAPGANARRMNDIKNACRFIKAMWGQV